jgi:hypothetical protein
MKTVVLKELLKGIFIVPISLAIILVPLSVLIGWNLTTLCLFWFMVIPASTVYLPKRISKNKDHLFESLMGLLVFYGIMVFLIYSHYKSDYFKVIIISCVINLVTVTFVTLIIKPPRQTTKAVK